MPNSERVLNRKVQVLIKIAPPYISISQKIWRVTREGVHYHFYPLRGKKWKINLK
jgi:hypothetical protein